MDKFKLKIQNKNIDKKSIFGILGSFFLVIGVFIPSVRFPITGSLNFFESSYLSGILLILLALASLVYVFYEKFDRLYAIGFASLGIVCFSLITLQPFVKVIDIEWGWLFLFTGVVLIFTCAISKYKTYLCFKVSPLIFNRQFSCIQFSGKLLGKEGYEIENGIIIIEGKNKKNKWIKMEKLLTNKTGDYLYRYSPETSGEKYFRARYIGDSLNKSKNSHIQKVKVEDFDF